MDAVDPQNPWLGLASFTEETRAYFYGREEEVAELARRVQRKLLTVLFGQSGLGKTSILRAGLVPRLRSQGYCPVYVRIDYAADAPPPAEQIKRVVAQTARHSGQWTQAGVAQDGESLWEYMHHRDDVLQDENGATLIPLLIFDQFEEIFTLAQSDDAGRARAARFVADLADLVENRPPRELEDKLDDDDAAAERFDFARSDYRVLIALREDYLAPLESLKTAMPSITQNRLRLAPMTGTQALAAVLKPGKGLVSDEVAAAIVRFVAGGAELANAEVEPSLLSLICRELNDARHAQGRTEISLDLLDGTQSSILSNFYERSLADQPPAVRQIVEDELLTASGYRENIAEERLIARLAGAGAAADTLATLVNRRLLRIEERLDVRRVELTHDVLCGVVKASRDVRKERESREAIERLLAEQRERERGARRQLVRARQIATVCAALAIAAIVAAVFAFVAMQRVQRAEAMAQATRHQAEVLLAYLSDDFARELESSGRLDSVAEIDKRQMDYFRAMPEPMKGRDTVRNGAMAMVGYARTQRMIGDMSLAMSTVTEGLGLLTQLQAAGDTSEQTQIAYALGLEVRAKILSNQADPKTLEVMEQAASTLRTLARAPNASVAVRRSYSVILVGLGFEDSHKRITYEKASDELAEAMQISEQLGALEMKDLSASVTYAEAGAWRLEALQALGRNYEARKVGEAAAEMATKVLEVRPGYRAALHAAQLTQLDLGALAYNDLRPRDAIDFGRRAEAIAITQQKLDPNNTVAANNMSVVYLGLGDAYMTIGDPKQMIELYGKALAIAGRAQHAGVWFVLNALYPRGSLAKTLADLNEMAASRKTFGEATAAVADLRKSESAASTVPTFAGCFLNTIGAGIALLDNDTATAHVKAAEATRMIEGLDWQNVAFGGVFASTCTYAAGVEKADAEYRTGNYKAAETSMRAALKAHENWPSTSDNDRRDEAFSTLILALAVARQGRLDEAAKIIDPILVFHRTLAARNQGDELLKIEMASALYTQAVSEPNVKTVRLHEASALMSSVSPALLTLKSTQIWRERILSGH